MKINKKITIFTVPSCGKCDSVKDYLKRQGRDYKEINVQGDFAALREMVRKTGSKTVPVTFVDDDYVVGLDLVRLKELMDQ